jgi:hypothetical protein
VGKTEGKRLLGRPRRRSEGIIKIDLRKVKRNGERFFRAVKGFIMLEISLAM